MANTTRYVWPGVLGLTLLVALAAWLWLGTAKRTPSALPPGASATPPSKSPAPLPRVDAPLDEVLRSASTTLLAAQGAAAARPRLAELRQALGAVSVNVTSAAIRR